MDRKPLDTGVKNLSRRDFIKLLRIGTGGLLLAIYLNGCGPMAESSDLEPLPQLTQPPFYMVNGEPQPTSQTLLKQVNQTLQGIGVASGNGYIFPEQTVVRTWSGWTTIEVPSSSGNNTLIVTDPIDLIINRKRIFTSGMWTPSTIRMETTVDATKTPSDKAIITTTTKNFKRFLDETGIKYEDVPEAVLKYYQYGTRYSVSSETGELDYIPGTVSFIYRLATALNLATDKLTEKMLTDNPEVNLDLVSGAAMEMRNKLVATLFSGDTTELATFFIKDINNPDDVEFAKKASQTLVEVITPYQERVNYIKSPELALAILKALDSLSNIIHNPADSAEVKATKNEKFEAISWLAEHDNGIWIPMESNKTKEDKEVLWLDLPETKPRALLVRKSMAEAKTDNNGVVTTDYSYGNEIVFLYPGTKQTLYFQQRKNKPPEEIVSEMVIASSKKTSQDELRKQGYEFSGKDWYIDSISEIDPQNVRLFYLPDKNQIWWGLPLKHDGELKEASFTGDFGSDLIRLFTRGDKFVSQEILLSSGKIYNSAANRWASDITEYWKQLMAEGVNKVTNLGLMSPQMLLARSSKGLYVPSDEMLQKLIISWFYQSIFNNKNVPYSYGFVMEDSISICDTDGNPIGCYLKRFEPFHFYKLTWLNINGEKKPYLVISPDDKFVIPLQINSLQLVGSGRSARQHEFLTTYLPWIIIGVYLAAKTPAAVGKTLEFFG